MLKIKTTLALVVFLVAILGCSSSSDAESEPIGEVYHKITLDVPIGGSSELLFGNNVTTNIFRNGQNFTTDKYLHGANENLSFQIITWFVIDCRSITVETFFKNKSIDVRTFRMGSLEPDASSPTLCKDGDQQIINLITPK